jgi:tetratricopeptide (TPR) repeat protein
MKILGSKLKGENPLPIFRDLQHHKDVKSDGTLSEGDLKKFGYETGFRVLPYTMQDRYDRNKEMIELKTIVLENDVLRAEFLPEYGGRLYSLYHKKLNRELLFRNPVFQPANLAIRSAWFSGGIEWNIAQLGHTFTTCEAVFFAKLMDDEDNEFVRMYEFERVKGLFWQVDFHLPRGAETLSAYVKIVNDNDTCVPMYWWTNIAVEENKNVRVFSGTDEVIYIKPETMGDEAHGMGRGKLPNLPSLKDVDASYPQNPDYSNEYFFQNTKEELCPWEAAAYDDGFIFFERSTQPLRYRKMFCWGSQRGGRRWCDFLALPGRGDYVEIQAGLAPTQLHGMDMEANSIIEFTQIFGGMQASNGERLQDEDWNQAKDAALQAVSNKLSQEEVLARHDKFKKLSAKAPQELLHYGSGWGSLEALYRKRNKGKGIPEGILFPADSMDDKQKPWINLLEAGSLKPIEIHKVPESWLTDMKWLPLIKKSLDKKEGYHYYTFLHLGVMLYENGYHDEALEAWKKSILLTPNPFAYRNMAVAMLQLDKKDLGLSYMEKSFELEGGQIDKAFAEEYLSLLITYNAFQKAWQLFKTLPETVSNDGRIQILAAQAAIEVGDYGYLKQVLSREFAVIREGENTLCELWFKYETLKLAEQKGIAYSDELLKEVKRTLTPPESIDFRMVREDRI